MAPPPMSHRLAPKIPRTFLTGVSISVFAQRSGGAAQCGSAFACAALCMALCVAVFGCGAIGPATTEIQVAAPPPIEVAPTSSSAAPDEPEPPPRAPKRPLRDEPTADPEEAADRNAARTMFLEGAEAYSQGDYHKAKDRFQRAYALVPEPPLLFNIASAELRLGNVAAACSLFRKYVTEGDPADPRVQEVHIQAAQRCRTP